MKGIQRVAQQAINYDDFLAQLSEPTSNVICTRRIGQLAHNIFSLELDKQGLCSFDDKRYLLPDGVNTLAHGHYKALAQFQDLLAQVQKHLTPATPGRRMRRAFVAAAHKSERAGGVEQSSCVLDNGEHAIAITHKTAVAQHRLPRATVHEMLDEMTGCDPRVEFAMASRTAPFHIITEKNDDTVDEDELQSAPNISRMLARVNTAFRTSRD